MSKEDIKQHEWTKGESGNPSGRPKGSKNRSTIVRELLEVILKRKNPLTGEEEWMSAEHHMTIAVLQKAFEKGDVNAYNALMNSGYGSPKDTVDVNTTETVSHDFKKLVSAIKFK